jgi:hypothetical protein
MLISRHQNTGHNWDIKVTRHNLKMYHSWNI